jgi:hypothetical protein
MSKMPELPRHIRAEVAFGLPLRSGVELVRSVGEGTIVVLGCDGCHEHLVGIGDTVDEPVTAGAVLRAARNDGATILSPDLLRIVRKHTVLNPQPETLTSDRGLRHVTAARFSAQTNHPVVVVSEERRDVTLFVGKDRFTLPEKADLRTKITDLMAIPDFASDEPTLRLLEGHFAELGSEDVELRRRYEATVIAAGSAPPIPAAAGSAHQPVATASRADKRSRRIRLLGPVFVDDELVTGSAANVLITLALSRNQQAPIHVLANVLGSDAPTNALDLAMNRLHALGLQICLDHNSSYVLDLGETKLDADEFINGVRNLPDPPRAAEMDHLMSLWRGDPTALHPRTRAFWHDLTTARMTFLQRVKEMPRREQRGLQGLDTFISHFPTRMPPWVFGVAALNGRRPGRERVLIVEDRIADVFVDQLGRQYDCVPLRSLQDWRDFVNEGDLDFDAALVDFHLTEAGNDAQGVEVLEYLRDHKGPPTTLISSAPKHGDLESLKRKYGLSGIYLKGPDDSLPALLSAIGRSINEGRPTPS